MRHHRQQQRANLVYNVALVVYSLLHTMRMRRSAKKPMKPKNKSRFLAMVCVACVACVVWQREEWATENSRGPQEIDTAPMSQNW